MLESQTQHVIDLPDLRGKRHVFANRRHAGQVLAGMFDELHGQDAIIFAIPAGGVPVAAEIAQRRGWPIEAAVVSKITLPWNSEVGYGAVAFDGSVQLNREFMVELGLESEVASEGVTATHEKVRRRVSAFRGERAPPRVTGRHVVLVDDGLASGYTMRVAVAALRKMGAESVMIAVPTAHSETVASIKGLVEKVFCANIRHRWPFAVADAYQTWHDVSEDEAVAALLEAKTYESD